MPTTKLRSNTSNSSVGLLLGISFIALCLAIGTWMLSSHMEAKTYNKITGTELTMWDAMWVNLRVDNTSN